MAKSTLKSLAYEQVARMGKALGHGGRLEILEALAQGPHAVEQLANAAGMSVASTSAHLQTLRTAGLVNSERRGSHVIYSIAGKPAARALIALREAAEAHRAELGKVVRDYQRDAGAFEAIDRMELARRMQRGEVVLLDVRPPAEYAHAHLSQARCMPLQELENHLKDLPSDKLIVAYCRGPYCLLSAEAVALLKSRGFAAIQLKDSVYDWQLAGLPVESSAEPPQQISTPN